MHQTERWQRIDADTLRILFTFDDPVNYSKPWTITFFWKLKKDWTMDAHPCTLSAIKEYDDRVNHADNSPAATSPEVAQVAQASACGVPPINQG